MKSLLKFALMSSTVLMFGVASATPPGMKPPSMGTRPVQSEGMPKSPNFWWPDQVDLTRLRQNTYTANPNPDFNYAEAFAQLNIKAVKADIADILTSSQDWWPADHGSYAGLFIRMAWHSAGTYRAGDGRGGSDGGQQRFEPLNSWPDNANLDKARRLLLPIKQKYGQNLSWSDLIILAGNVALEEGGLDLAGFAGGRADAWEPELVYWGPETKFLDSERFSEGRKLEGDLAASQMGLIYVNPEGPDGNPDILASAQDIRTTFARMGMNDEDTVALIVGGHTIGKLHGATKAEGCVGPEPAAEGVEKQGFGWTSKCGTGKGPDTFTSGFEGIWTATPTAWSNNFVENLYNFEWEKTKSPAGVFQWIPKNVEDAKFIPDAFDPDKFHAPVMLTTDLAMRYDPAYGKITKRYLEEPGSMDKAFANAWYKLTHRDMGAKARYVVVDKASKASFTWQDPIQEVDSKPINARSIRKLKSKIRGSGLSNSELVRAAWASAVTFRDTDYRGGANGARLRLAPQKDWDVNNPKELEKTINVLEGIQEDFNSSAGSKKISMADMIVLGGAVAVEEAAKASGQTVKVPFTPGRGDAVESQTDIASFELLRPAADGFRNYHSNRARLSPAKMLIDRADMLTLSAPEMTVLIGGLRAMDANAKNSKLGVLTERPGTLSNDFFKNLLDMSTEWTPAKDGAFEGRDRKTGKLKWTASEVDLMFGSNAELRAIAEYYGSEDGNEKFINDFIKAWTKVMTLDRYDLK